MFIVDKNSHQELSGIDQGVFFAHAVAAREQNIEFNIRNHDDDDDDDDDDLTDAFIKQSTYCQFITIS